MRKLLLIIILLLLTMAGGCLTLPEPPKNYTIPQLKYRLLDHYGENEFFFCDPDFYPIPHDDELDKALEYFPIVQNNSDEFTAITLRMGLNPPYTNEAKLAIYREYKKLRAIPLTPTSEGVYDYTLQLGSMGGSGRRVSGVIRSDGTIREQKSDEVILTCPICLDEDTEIDTPHGSRPVKDLQVGMIVWSLTRGGSRIAVPILQSSCTYTSPDHRMVNLSLDDGRWVEASFGHTTIDNRAIEVLAVGDRVDGAIVAAVHSKLYEKKFVCDILPAGETKVYWANDILLKSTLKDNRGL